MHHLSAKKKTSAGALAAFSSFGLLLFIWLYPFFLPNKYFKMTIGKMYFFYAVTGLFALGCLILYFAQKQKKPLFPPKTDMTDLTGALFLFVAVVSCAASNYRKEAFTGEAGRYMGLLTFLMIGCAYFFISRFGKLTSAVVWIFGASTVVMNVIALLQFRGFDPLGLYAGTQQTVRINFMSLVGNKDVYYSYLALTVPFAMYLSYDAQTLQEKIFWHTAAFFGFAGAFACNSDGVFMALIPAFLLLFFLKGKEQADLQCFLRNVMTFFGAALLVALIKPDLSQFGIMETLVMRLLIKPLPCLCALAGTAVIYAVLLKIRLAPAFIKALRIFFLCLLAAAVAGLIGAFIYFTFFNTTADIGGFSEFLRFDSLYWGNKRGYVWSRLLQIFKEFPLYRMLIGYGEETVGILMKDRFGSEMVQKTGLSFDNAHNEFLQYLITMGILGLLTYLLFVGSAVKRGFKEGGRFCRAATLCCVCYLAQSFVNISQVITTPLFFVFLALAQTDAVEKSLEAAAAKPPKKQTAKR